MNARFTKTTLIVGVSAVLAGLSGIASAQESNFDATHPRRAEVNGRLANQNARVDNKVANGGMSKHEASKIHKEDHQIRQEERTMASHDDGHLTKADQRSLNQQENSVSRQIANH